MIKSIDQRGWVSVGLFALTFFIFGLIAWKPAITSNQVFTLLAQAVVISGLIGGPIAFLFGASKKEPPPSDPQP